MSDDMEEGTFTDEDVPENGMVLTLDAERMGFWLIGDVDPNTKKVAHSLYRLVAFCSANGEKVSRSVDTITGRLN